MKLKKGDKVQVLKGKDAGKTGTIEKVLPKLGLAVVEGANLVKKHQKPTPGRKSGIFEVAKPLPIPSLALVCPKCEKPARVGFKIIAKRKIRFCKKCGEQI